MKLIVALLLMISNAFALEGLKVGDYAPELKLKTLANKTIDLRDGKDKVLIFYRGSWCPYCMNQLKDVEKDLKSLIDSKDVQVLGLSVDQKKVALKMKRNHKYKLSVISDPKAKTLKAFKIINKVDPKLVKKYKQAYGIDLEADSGEKHHMIAHPAVFIIKKGKIVFADVHTDYKKRTDNQKILSFFK